jgi:predicted RNA-binding Zn-ribbon protein involved in translation (DUF1610 family)
LHKVALLRCFSKYCIQTFLSLLRVCSTCNLIKKREKKTTFICGKCRNTTAHSSQNVLQRNTLYYMKWIKYKTVCAELSFAIAHSHLGQNSIYWCLVCKLGNANIYIALFNLNSN